jgi:hypothetical protein
MGRGRAKAKQTKVARELKYRSAPTDLKSLEAELRGSSGYDDAIPPNYADLAEAYRDADEDEYEEYEDIYGEDDEDDEEESEDGPDGR